MGIAGIHGAMEGLPPAFFGREAELSEMAGLLRSGKRLITIVAPGGYGKSRLARELVSRGASLFPGGVHEIKLAPLRDPGRIAGAAADTLGLRLLHDSDPLDLLVDYLRYKEVLLYFDNFEHLAAGAQVIAALLDAAPGLSVLASSREPLGLAGERVFRLEALPVAEGGKTSPGLPLSTSAQLFADRAALASPGFLVTDENRGAVETICVILEGVPLALELAAAWVDAYDLGRINGALREHLDIAARDDAVESRHRSVRASCDWSWELVDTNLRLALRCMSVFRGGFTPDQAAAILPERGLAESLRRLADRSWLVARNTVQGPRYEMHDAAIREYAFQRLLNSDDYEIAVTAHCRLFATLLERESARLAGTGQLEAMLVLGNELENILEALDSALHRTDDGLVRTFARNLQQYLLMVGEARECRSRYLELRDWFQGQEPARSCPATDLGLARASLQLGNYADARELAVEAGFTARSAGLTAIQARAEAALGEIERLEGNHTAARFHYTNSLELMRAAANPGGMAEALQGLGRVEMVESDFSTARKLVSESLDRRRELGDRFGIAQCLNDLGNMAYREGDYDAASSLHTESLELRQQLGDLHGIAESLNNLGNVEFSRCDYHAAWDLYSESHRIRTATGNRFGIAACLNNLGNVEYCEGNFDSARELHEQGLAIKREIGDRIGLSYSLNNLGNIGTVQGRGPDAARLLREAIEIAIEIGSKDCTLAPLGIASCLLTQCGRQRVAGLLYYGTAEQLRQTGLALDPMDGGMLAEAGRLLAESLDRSELDELQAAAAAMSLDELAELAVKHLAVEHTKK